MLGKETQSNQTNISNSKTSNQNPISHQKRVKEQKQENLKTLVRHFKISVSVSVQSEDSIFINMW